LLPRLIPRNGFASRQDLGPTHVCNAIKFFVGLNLLDLLDDGINDEGVSRVASMFGRRSDTLLQVAFHANRVIVAMRSLPASDFDDLIERFTSSLKHSRRDLLPGVHPRTPHTPVE
jgi:hypothetical protein